MPSFAWKFKAAARLSTSGLDYTIFSNGQFMDYSVATRVPSPFPMNPPLFFDLEHRCARLPGDGSAVLALSHSSDVGRFVSALISLPEPWEHRQYYLAGDRQTLNDYVKICEEGMGCEFEKTYFSVESLEKGEYTPLPGLKKGLPEGMADMVPPGIRDVTKKTALGMMDLPQEPETDLKRMFPGLKTLTIEDIVKTHFRE